jgi:hypothetical protein
MHEINEPPKNIKDKIFKIFFDRGGSFINISHNLKTKIINW